LENQNPFIVQNYPTSVAIFAHQDYSWMLDLDYDAEGDDAIFDVKIKDINNVTLTTASWF
jgi:hypothetical protein